MLHTVSELVAGDVQQARRLRLVPVGWIGTQDVQPGFKEVLSLQAGGISKPMKSAAGWHIIKVHETKPKTVPPLAEVRKKVEARALDAKKRGGARVMGRETPGRE